MKKTFLTFTMIFGINSVAMADVVFGINSSGTLFEASSMENLLVGDSIAHAPNSQSWSSDNSFFMADGSLYAVNDDDKLIEYSSVSNMWNGLNGIDHGHSSDWWSNDNEYFAHDGAYYAITTAGVLVRSRSALYLWWGLYDVIFGNTPNGWDSSNPFLMSDDGVYAFSNSSSTYAWSTGDDVSYGTARSTLISYYVPYGWSQSDAYFSGNTVEGIALTAEGNLKSAQDVSAPLSIGALSLLGAALLRRKKVK